MNVAFTPAMRLRLMTLGDIFLAGPWTLRGAEDRVLAACQGVVKSSRWVSPLVGRIFYHFPARQPPNRSEMFQCLLQDRRLFNVLRKLDPLPLFSLIAAMVPRMAPVNDRFLKWNLPSITSTIELAKWLGISSAELRWLTGTRRDRPVEKEHYRYRWMPRPGRPRLFEIPRLRLKQAQRKLTELFAFIPPHAAAHGFVPGRSVASCLEPHVGKEVVLRMDLRHFFPSIRRGRVMAMLRDFGYPQLVAQLIARLVTATVPQPILEQARSLCGEQAFEVLSHDLGQPHLPQGAPTSPVIANLVAWKLDCRLAGLAERMGANYTRYADDLIFSGDQSFGRGLAKFREFVLAIAIDEGFFIRHHKTRTMRRGGRQSAAGLVMNERLNVPRDEYDQLRAILHNCARDGLAVQNRDEHPDFWAHLKGRVAYVAATNSVRGLKLAGLLRQIQDQLDGAAG